MENKIGLSSTDEVIVNQVIQRLYSKKIPMEMELVNTGFRCDYPVIVWDGEKLKQFRRTPYNLKGVRQMEPELFIREVESILSISI